MSDLTIKGKVTKILDPENGTSQTGKEWNKQEFVIETIDRYPKDVCFTCFGDKTDLLMKIKLGQTVDVSFNIESREYNGKWFHNVNAWKIIIDQEQQDEHIESTHDLPPEFNEPEPEPNDDENLPF